METARLWRILRPLVFLVIVVLFVGCKWWGGHTGGHSVSGESAFTVSSTFPAKGATGVSIDINPSVTFSETIDPATITNSTITLSVLGNEVICHVTASGSTATFRPVYPLSEGTMYIVKITKDLKDSSGNALSSEYTWTFVTEGGTQTPAESLEAGGWVKAAAGWEHTAAIKVDGTLWAWGYNSYGQLGDGTNADKSIPVKVGSGTTWATLAAGDHFTLAIREDGTLWTWGENQYGQLGDGTHTDRHSPVRMGSHSYWAAVAGGGNHSVAITKEGTLWTWGSNHFGQLGDGTLTDTSSPVRVGSDADWAAVAAGRNFTIAIKINGTMWEWGDKTYGLLVGDNPSASARNTPTQYGSDSDWKEIGAGGYSAIALKDDSSLWPVGWVDNVLGISGLGTLWSAVAAGGNNTMALKADGSLWVDGGQVGSDTDWAVVAAGGAHFVAIKKNGTIWTWGRNFYGQLGDGTQIDENTPEQIGF
ncbi:MAG: Ig-like domain-containing protein [Desulfomonilia bacterium]